MCNTYTIFCGSTNHENEETCHTIMRKYYGVINKNTQYYVCPQCECVEMTNYEEFYYNHNSHLGQFNVRKRLLFSQIMLNVRIQEERRLLNQPIPSDIDINNQSDNIPVPSDSQTLHDGNDDIFQNISFSPVENSIQRKHFLRKVLLEVLEEDNQSNDLLQNECSLQAGTGVLNQRKYFLKSVLLAVYENEQISNNDDTSAMVNPTTSMRPREPIQSATGESLLQSTSNVNQIGFGLINIKRHLNGNYVSIKMQSEGIEINVTTNLKEKLESEIRRMKNVKIQFCLRAEFSKDDGELKEWFVSHRAINYYADFITDVSNILKEKISNYSDMSSGWRLIKIKEISFILTRVSDIIYLSGSSYIPTPMKLLQSRSVVNVQNNDNLCFLYSILSILKFDEIQHNRQRVTHYIPYINSLKYENEKMPMKLKDIARFEKDNELSINVFQFTNDNNHTIEEDIVKNPNVDIVYRSTNQGGTAINLIVFGNEDKFHYAAIVNLDRLLNMDNDMGQIRCKWCHKCLHGFRSATSYEKHLALCNLNNQCTLYTMPEKKHIKFEDWSKTISPYFRIYADFESILADDDKYFQKHLPASAGLLLMSNNINHEYHSFNGENSIIQFLEKIDEIVNIIVRPWYDMNAYKTMIVTNADMSNYLKSKKCYLCGIENERLVRDHNHLTGDYLGAACNKCNLSRRMSRKPNLPVVFHNLKGYDLHHILKHGISKFKKWNISCIPQTSEKFLSLIVHTEYATIRFIDSLQFLNASLANLSNNIIDFPITSMAFQRNEVNGKGIFPYSFAKSLNILTETTELPCQSEFENVSDNQYEAAQTLWRNKNFSNLLEYMMYYMKLDIYLLADIFETFRIKALQEDGLEPLNFFSIPGLSWASALKSLKHDVELLHDPEMYKLFESGIRGGMTFTNCHHVEANNSTQLLYIDINNLYGWALSQPLPYSDFIWIENENELYNILQNLSTIDTISSEHGYLLEVDLEVPSHLHDKLDDLPIGPESKCPPNSKVKKLLLTHENKYNYAIHWRLLQYYIQLGVKVVKINRAIKFRQACIFKDYIEYNSNKRKSATTKFDRDYYKLKNNSLYGKTVENLLKRLNLRFCNTPQKLITYASKLNFKRSFLIDDDFVAVTLNKDVICLDRPSYIGQVVLDISKLRMYQLQYNELEKYRMEFNCEIKIAAGDTDSFFLACKNVDLDRQLLPAMIRDQLLDTSNYNISSHLYSNNLASKIGKFKDESGGNIKYKEWIFLRPKCYSLSENDSKYTMKAKGVNINKSGLSHEDYKQIYEDGGVKSINHTRIGSINHQLYTIKTKKVALNGLDNKRYWTDKNKSYAYGHYKLTNV